MNRVQRRAPRGQSLAPFIVVASLSAYPLLGTLVAATPFSSLVASLPVRALVAVAALMMLLDRRRVTLSPSMVALWGFWFIYLLRLLWDTAVAGVPGADEALFYFVATCLLPAAALLNARRSAFDELRLARLFLVLGCVTCLLALTFTWTAIGASRSLFADTGRLFFDTVNPITYGHVAVTTVLAATILLHRRGRHGGIAFVLLSIGAAATVLQLSASRGPAIALAVCLLVASVFQKRLRWWALAVATVTTVLIALSGVALEERFVSVEDDPSALERVVLQSNAIGQFLDSPVLGSAYIETELQSHPHNPVVESAMATGVPGLILFMVVVLSVVVKIVQLLRQGQLLIPLLTLQYLMASMLSGALFLSTQMWVVFALVMAMTNAPRPARRKRRRPTRLAATFQPAG